MDMSRWKNVAFWLSFLFCILVYLTTCIVNRKHGLSNLSESPKWMNFLFDKVLENIDDMSTKCPVCKEYDFKQAATGEYNCRNLPVLKNLTLNICFPHEQQHALAIRTTIIQETKERFAKDVTMGFIDVGSKLGVYGLAAARMGHKVLCIEPNMVNVEQIHKSVISNGFQDNVALLVNAINDRRGPGEILFNNIDSSRSRIVQIEAPTGSSYIDSSSATQFITLNDIVEFCDFDQAIMRIDVEGFEHRAFASSEELFSRIDIPMILMEWVHMKDRLRAGKWTEDSKLIFRMIKLLLDLGYKPKSLQREMLKIGNPYEWPSDIMWVRNSL